MDSAGSSQFHSSLSPTLAALVDANNPPPRVIQRLGSSGFRHVQISATLSGMRPRELDRSARRDLMAHLRRAELSLSGVDCWIPAADFAEGHSVDRATSVVMAAVELAADLGRVPLSVVAPASDEIVTTLAAHAQHHGVPLADHSIPLPNKPELGLGIDPAAWLSQSLDPADAVIQAGQRLVSVRLCDLSDTGMRMPLDARRPGRLDVVAYRAALAALWGDRPLVIDARQWTDPWDGIERTRASWGN